MDADSDRLDQNLQKIFRTLTISGSATTNPKYYEYKQFKNLKATTFLKRKINLLQAYFELPIYQIK
jgi:hypothetical protein